MLINYIKRIFINHFLSTMEKEIKTFIVSLQDASDNEIGMLLVAATHIRNNFYQKEKLDMCDPILSVTQDPFCANKFNKMIRKFQSKKLLLNAAGSMVWLHTARAASEPQLRIYGRKMWAELIRGFPYVESAKKDLISITKNDTQIDISGYDRIPIGLEPKL